MAAVRVHGVDVGWVRLPAPRPIQKSALKRFFVFDNYNWQGGRSENLFSFRPSEPII